MSGKIKRNIGLWMVLVILMTYVSPLYVFAENEEDFQSGESYSTGPEYIFQSDKSAEEQLNDIFTTLDLQDATISVLQDEMAKGNLTSEKLTQMYLDRIYAYDKEKDLNSIIWINENALSDARALDEERAAGNIRGKLHGIPIVVKDNYNVKGMPTSAGAVALSTLIAAEDAGTVKKLKDAGAVIIAKANMSEFAWSACDSHSTLGGDAHNAYDTSRSCGGSSGGTATAVRSNFAAAGLGTDTGGSIRNPSSWSNLYGIRPSKGLTSIGGVIPLSTCSDTTGPMAKSAEDLAIVLEAMAGEDPEDDYTLEIQADKLKGNGYSGDLSEGSLKGKRIAYLSSSFDYKKPDVKKINEIIFEITGIENYYPENFFEESRMLSGEIEILSRRARAYLKKAGAEFVDLSGKITDEELVIYASGNSPSSSEGYDYLEYDINCFLDRYCPENDKMTVKDIIESGGGIGYISDYLGYALSGKKLTDVFDKDDYEKYGYFPFSEAGYLRHDGWQYVLDERNRISEILRENDVDAIMYLCFESPAPLQNNYEYPYNPSNYDYYFGPGLGLPDINIPMGFMQPLSGESSIKLPIGLGLVGNFGGEKELMEIAYAYEKEAGEVLKKAPEITPALRDESLNSYLDALMEEACALDPAKYGGEKSSKFRKLYDAYDKALAADYSDPDSVYEASYELAVAYDKIISAYNEKRKAAGTVLVKGERLTDIFSSMFGEVEGITDFSSEDKKIASVSKKGVILARKAGKTLINALDSKDKKNIQILSQSTVTVVDKPKLKFTETYTLSDVGKMINANEFLVSSDYDLLDVDKWTSSRPATADIDGETGLITINGKGSTRITAYFGNIKVTGYLRVKNK